MRRRQMTFGQRREYRRMMRLVQELDRADAGLPPKRAAVRRLASRLLLAVISTMLVAVFGLVVAHKVWGVSVTSNGLRLPHPLGRPPHVAKGLGAFSFLQTQPDDPSRPVAYDPCRPVEYEVNDTLAPPGTGVLLQDAVQRISHATGLQFQYVGRTDRLPDTNAHDFRALRQPALIAWTTPQVVPELDGRTAGIGGSTPRRDDFSGDLEFVTGTVALDAPDLTVVMGGPDGPAQARAIVLHELGHLVGLGHVNDANELMYGDNAGRLDLGPGDREGLALLGSGPCYH